MPPPPVPQNPPADAGAPVAFGDLQVGTTYYKRSPAGYYTKYVIVAHIPNGVRIRPPVAAPWVVEEDFVENPQHQWLMIVQPQAAGRRRRNTRRRRAHRRTHRRTRRN
jgi:CelD/BcsL family acetyltransferase involved in cellulose biosynthesis